jgi:hypothetical protein
VPPSTEIPNKSSSGFVVIGETLLHETPFQKRMSVGFVNPLDAAAQPWVLSWKNNDVIV